MTTVESIVVDSLYLLALINPISKIAVLSGLSSSAAPKELSLVVRRSTLTAAGILLGAMFFGDFILRSIFHVALHSLRVSGGVVLFWVGFTALRKGVFFEQDAHGPVVDLAIVPLACPMIAGPATIAASITLTARAGIWGPAASVLIALLINAGFMLYARPLAAALHRLDILSALIRITGLIVMTIGTQMVFDGCAEWRAALPP